MDQLLREEVTSTETGPLLSTSNNVRNPLVGITRWVLLMLDVSSKWVVAEFLRRTISSQQIFCILEVDGYGIPAVPCPPDPKSSSRKAFETSKMAHFRDDFPSERNLVLVIFHGEQLVISRW